MLACSAYPHTDVIKDGDLVIVYESYASMKAIVVTKNGRFDNRYGSFAHKDWIGQRYGTKVYCKPPSRGWVYLIAPTPELWSLVLRHRTQILYVADISLVCMYLELRPGSVVLESGTGSGSLTHSLARTVAPTGHVHTFEFHELRCQEAEKEFKQHSLEPFVTIRLRNIEEQGFPEELHGKADGLFLDLPGPWKVVPSAAACLKPDGRFCSFSPCIEQVQRTCLALDEHGFTDIVTYECLLRVHEVWTEQVQTEFETLAKRRRVAQVTEVAEEQQQQQQAQGAEAGSSEAAQEQQEQQEQQDGSQEAAAASADAGGAAAATGAAGAGSTPGRGKGRQQQQQRQKQQQPQYAQERVVVTKPAMDAKGHTGYLTFARKFVR